MSPGSVPRRSWTWRTDGWIRCIQVRGAAFGTCLEALEEGRVPTGLIYRGGPVAVVPNPGPAHVDLTGMTTDFREIMESYTV